MPTARLLEWSGLEKSSYYYKPKNGKKGAKPSRMTVDSDGVLHDNAVVVRHIEETLHQEFCCYGYKNMTGELCERGWIINHKKVYRLMKEHRLLYGGKIRVAPFKRDFIQLRSPEAVHPLQYLSMDIKYVHIHGWKRNVLLLTVMDICTRKVLIHMLKASIKKGRRASDALPHADGLQDRRYDAQK